MSFQHYVVSVASGEAYDFFIVARGACLCYDDARLARALQRVASGKESGTSFNSGHRALRSRNASSHTLWRVSAEILGKGPPETYRGRLSFSGSRSPACGLTALNVSPWVFTV